eukprot:jgi/Mesvir1/24822/Mv22062-RA.2
MRHEGQMQSPKPPIPSPKGLPHEAAEGKHCAGPSDSAVAEGMPVAGRIDVAANRSRNDGDKAHQTLPLTPNGQSTAGLPPVAPGRSHREQGGPASDVRTPIKAARSQELSVACGDASQAGVPADVSVPAVDVVTPPAWQEPPGVMPFSREYVELVLGDVLACLATRSGRVAPLAGGAGQVRGEATRPDVRGGEDAAQGGGVTRDARQTGEAGGQRVREGQGDECGKEAGEGRDGGEGRRNGEGEGGHGVDRVPVGGRTTGMSKRPRDADAGDSGDDDDVSVAGHRQQRPRVEATTRSSGVLPRETGSSLGTACTGGRARAADARISGESSNAHREGFVKQETEGPVVKVEDGGEDGRYSASPMAWDTSSPRVLTAGKEGSAWERRPTHIPTVPLAEVPLFSMPVSELPGGGSTNLLVGDGVTDEEGSLDVPALERSFAKYMAQKDEGGRDRVYASLVLQLESLNALDQGASAGAADVLGRRVGAVTIDGAAAAMPITSLGGSTRGQPDGTGSGGRDVSQRAAWAGHVPAHLWRAIARLSFAALRAMWLLVLQRQYEEHVLVLRQLRAAGNADAVKRAEAKVRHPGRLGLLAAGDRAVDAAGCTKCHFAGCASCRGKVNYDETSYLPACTVHWHRQQVEKLWELKAESMFLSCTST